MNVFDLHSDIWIDVTIHRLRGEKDVFHNRHAARLKKGGIEGAIFAVWVDPPNDADYAKRTHEIMSAARDEIAETKDFRIVHNVAEIERAKKDGIFYVLPGVEGMAYVGSDISRVDEYYEFGARHGMLTWNEANSLAAGANSDSDHGLTDMGKKVVARMQDLGMLVDVSHLNAAGFWDIVDITRKPFIASHSDCSALCGVPRNLTDDQLRAIRDANGVVGINSFNVHTDADPRRQTVEHLARHAAHMIDIMGIDHVACGFDFFEFVEDENTMSTMVSAGSGAAASETPAVRGMKDASEVPALFECLKKMGLSEAELEKIAFKNALRVLKDTIG